MSLLATAAEVGDTDCISQIVNAGVDINAQYNGQTACHAAVRHGHLSAVRLLVERGADTFALDRNGLSLLDWALTLHDEAISLFLLDAGAPLKHMYHAVSGIATASIAVLKRLLERSLDIAALRDASGRTILHQVGLVDVNPDSLDAENAANRLLFFVDVANVDINTVDGYGRSALYPLAFEVSLRGRYVSNRHWFNLLLALGIDVCMRDMGGGTICHVVACYTNYVALCSCLAFGGKLDDANHVGDTARVLAFQNDCAIPTKADIDAARRRIEKIRLDLVRQRAFQVCVGLQSLDLDALQTCEILMHSCGSVGHLIEFHQWWAIATTVKHFS